MPTQKLSYCLSFFEHLLPGKLRIDVTNEQVKEIFMNGQNRKDIYLGVAVEIILKKDQRSGNRTFGIVKDILTSSAFHSRGIKVRLQDGQIGRVVEVTDPAVNS